jgi:nitroreductase
MNHGIINSNKKEIRVELMQAIKSRRSIRKNKPDPVSDRVLQKVLEAVRWSPSWANTQCWEFIVIRDGKMESELAGTLPKTNSALSWMTEVPLVIVLCGKKGVSGFKKGEPGTAKVDWVMFDTDLAMQSLCLAAYGLRLGAVVVRLFDYRKTEEILGVPQNLEVVAMILVRYPGNPKT